MTLLEAQALFLTCCSIDKNLSSLTVKAYRTDLKQFRSFTNSIGIVHAENISPLTIQAFVADLKNIHKYESSSIRRKIAVLRALLKYLERNELIAANPFAKVQMTFRQEKKLPRVLDRGQIEQLLAEANRACRGTRSESTTLRDRALLELLFYSGARISELLNLDIGDINFEAGSTKIKGKGRRERIIYLGCDPVIRALKSYLRVRNKISLSCAALFLNRSNRRLSSFSAALIVRKYAAAASVSQKVTPHMFRHTMATMLLENGADLRSIQEILGHASLSTTEIYTHVSADRKRQVMSEYHPRQSINLTRRRRA